MEYRQLGKTELKVSTIGLGCEYFDVAKVPFSETEKTINYALDNGINIFDVFMPGREIREDIKNALGNRRSEAIIQGHIGSTDVNLQYDISRDMPTVKKYFEDMLRIFGRIEIGMLFFIDSEDDYKSVFETEFITYAQKLKQQGDIGHIGFSSHNPITAIKVVETGVVETMLFSINPAFDLMPEDENIFNHLQNGFNRERFLGIDPTRAALYNLCEQKGIGITVMKPLGSGKLISPEHTPFEKPLTIGQCLQYALDRPGVASILPGCKSVEELQGVLNYFTLSEEEKDYSQILMNKNFKGACVYCNHCQPCPMTIDIAAVNKYLDIAKLDPKNIPPSVISHYQNLKYRGEHCIECGHCEHNCPFDVPVISNMQEADHLLA